jgi:hypothetical protein
MSGKGTGEIMEQQDRIMDGDLQTLGLQSILKMLALSEKTGSLLVHSGPETLSISLRKGQVVGLREEGVPQPDLLAMFCLINKLDPPRAQHLREQSGGQIQLALAKMVEYRWISPNEMQRRLEFAITQAISHALRWSSGRFAFHRQLVPLDNGIQPLDVDSVLLEALRQADEWAEIGDMLLSRATTVRWLPEVNNDVRSLGLSREYIEVLCLCNGDIPLQAMALVLMMPEARIARILVRLLELRLVEIVDTAFETELQQDLSNLLIRCQTFLARPQKSARPEQRLVRLASTLAECINGLLEHHGKYAKSLRGRGQLPSMEISRFLEGKFAHQLRVLSKQHYAILETVEFTNGKLDCSSILTLDKLVKGNQLEEFYWEAVLGLAAYLRMIFTEVLHDEVGNSHVGYSLTIVWKAFLTEIDREIQQYQLFRAHRNTQLTRGRDASQSGQLAVVQPWQPAPGGSEGTSYWPPESQRRTI